jgi:hypothetical protein
MSRKQRILRIVVATSVLWLTFLLPWSGPSWLDLAQPALIAVAFAVLSHVLGFGSWLLTVSFSVLMLGMFAMATTYGLYADASGTNAVPKGFIAALAGLLTIASAPFYFLAPLVLSSAAYYAARRTWPNNAYMDSTRE